MHEEHLNRTALSVRRAPTRIVAVDIERPMQQCRDAIKQHRRAQSAELAGVVSLIFVVFLVFALQSQTASADFNARSTSLVARQDDQKRIASAAEDNIKVLAAKAPSQLPPSENGKREVASEMLGDIGRRAWAVDADQFLYLYDQRKAAIDQVKKYEEEIAKLGPPAAISDKELYGAGALLIVFISVFVGLYRTHLREINRNEVFLFALLRIQAAASAGDAAIDPDVKACLLKDPFEVPREPSILRREKNIESPLPGHPTSDLSAMLVNKLLDQVELIVKPKDKADNIHS
jgi:hypothetical protein